jgi:hypothetical protein
LPVLPGKWDMVRVHTIHIPLQETCPRRCKGSFLGFFRGCLSALSAARARTLWIASNGPVRLSTCEPCSLGNRVTLRSDLGQSQSGNSTLSPRAYRAKARSPNWPYRRFDRSPLSMPLDTSVDAPSRGAKVSVTGGGRTDRWPQLTAIPTPRILLLLN